MFSSIGWGEIAVLIAAGLIILGPERLPGAVSWTMQSIRKVRDYATGATGQLKDELGTDFEDFRKPLAELNELRQMSPRAIVTKHLLDGDDSVFRTVQESLTVEKLTGDTPPIKPVSAPVPTDETAVAPSTAAGPSLTKNSLTKKASASSGEPRHDVGDWDAT